MNEIMRKKLNICKLQYPAQCDYQILNCEYTSCGAIVGEGGIAECIYREKAILILQKDG